MADSMQEITVRVTSIEAKVDSHIESTNKTTAAIIKDVGEIKNNTQEIIDIFKSAKIAARLLIGLGKFAKWVTAIAAAVALIWGLVYAYKHGTPPPNPL